MPQRGTTAFLPPGAVSTIYQRGTRSSLNIAAAANISPNFGTLVTVSVVNPGTAGALTFNDCTSTASAAASNVIITIPYTNLWAGKILKLFFPALSGITVSAMPAGGAVDVSYN